MAIRRCPYCKAIIDEGLEYCSNCGTQLIFPEDEFVDEEIPGEKIVDVNDEESEPQEEEVSGVSKDLTAAQEDIESEKPDEVEEDKEAEEGSSKLSEEEKLKVKSSEWTEKKGGGGETPEEVSDKEPIPVEEPDEIPDTEGTFVESGELAEEPAEEIESIESEEFSEQDVQLERVDRKISSEKAAELEKNEISREEEPQKNEKLPDEQRPDDLREPSAKATPDSEEISQVEDVFAGVEEETGEISKESESLNFKTEDLEKIVDPAEKEKEEIEQFLNSLKEEREKTKKYYEETGELPPWAQSMKEGSLSSIARDGESEEGEEAHVPEEERLPAEEKFIEEEKPIEEEVPPVAEVSASADTGMGLPEGIDQKGLPFNQDFHEEETEEERRSYFRHKDMNFPSWIKSRVFDVLMIAGLWLVTVWLASAVTKASFFQLMTASPIPILIFLAILLIVYFFLFFFFLGETLGDQLFSQEE